MADVLGGFEHRVLLALMRLGERSYSVPVVRELERRNDRTVSPAAVYLTLRRLEKKGLVTSVMEPPGEGEGGRERRVFAITPQAVEVLRAARSELARLWDGVEALEP